MIDWFSETVIPHTSCCDAVVIRITSLDNDRRNCIKSSRKYYSTLEDQENGRIVK